MKANNKLPEVENTNAVEFIKIDPPEPLIYYEHSDYPYCICGNFEKDDGFNCCDKYGNLIPVSFPAKLNRYGRCERRGRIIDGKNRTIIGRLKNFQKRS